MQNEVLTQALAVMIRCLKYADNIKSHHWWQLADFKWMMQNKEDFWMNNHISQILNNDLDVFFLSDFHHQSLILVFTVGAGCVFTLTAISESHHSQLLKSIIIFTSTMSCEQWVFISESASFTGLSFNLNWNQGSLQISSFCGEIEN